MRPLAAVCCAMALVCGPRAWAGGDLVLRNAVMVDVHGRRTTDAIVIRDGRITSIGVMPDDAVGLESIDLGGAVVTPGLIDSHVHLSGVPGAGLRDDSLEQTEEMQRMHLRAYLSCGVTTVVDAGILPSEALRIESWIADGAASPRIRWVGPIFSPEGGYVAAIMPKFPTARSREDVVSQLDGFATLKPIGVKLSFENGFFGKVWPLYDDALRDTIVDETDARGLHRFVHAMSADEYRAALVTRPYVMLHTVESGARRVSKALVAGQTYVVSTLATDDILRIEFKPERMLEPPYAWSIPERERVTASAPKALRLMHDALVKMIVPGVPMLYPIVWGITYMPVTQHLRLLQLERQLQILKRAGVPILLGTDSGNWPMFPWVFHGPTTVHELELMVDAGLSPLDAIVAATATPARMLGMEQELGEVEVGFDADLIVLDADPLVDIRAFRTPRLIVQDGVAKTSAEWMSLAP